MDTLSNVLNALIELPPLVLYLILGIGAAVENIIPPVPADTFVLAGALLAERGAATPWLVFVVTWVFNVGSATAVFFLARRYGRGFFKLPIARWLLREHQLDQIGTFYGRWGVPATFFSRFLPAWRAMVPVFAGISHMNVWKVLPSIALASALWYGVLVYLGAFMGRNLQAIVNIFNSISGVLLWVALALLAALAVWWWRSRHPAGQDEP